MLESLRNSKALKGLAFLGSSLLAEASFPNSARTEELSSPSKAVPTQEAALSVSEKWLEVLRETRPAVVKLTLHGKNAGTTASGVFIETPERFKALIGEDEAVLLTAAHFLQDYIHGEHTITADVFFENSTKSNSCRARVLPYYSEKHCPDIGLIRVKIPPKARVKKLSFAAEKVYHFGEELLVLGFPGGKEFTATECRVIADNKEAVPSNGELLPRNISLNQLVLQGTSGGPLVTERGKLVGIVSCSTTVSKDTRDFFLPGMDEFVKMIDEEDRAPITIPHGTDIGNFFKERDAKRLKRIEEKKQELLTKYQAVHSTGERTGVVPASYLGGLVEGAFSNYQKLLALYETKYKREVILPAQKIQNYPKELQDEIAKQTYELFCYRNRSLIEELAVFLPDGDEFLRKHFLRPGNTETVFTGVELREWGRRE